MFLAEHACPFSQGALIYSIYLWPEGEALLIALRCSSAVRRDAVAVSQGISSGASMYDRTL